jgi:sigma-B regulation protein RsbU (phosphoserine phosphatase)
VTEALDLAACGLLQTATDGTILRANRVFCAWVGYGPELLVGQRRFQDLLSMGGRIFHQTHWAPLLQLQGSISEVKLELLHRDGNPIPMVLNAVRHDVGSRTVHELAAYVARDRDKYESELVQSRKRLEIAVAESLRLQAEAKDRAAFAEQMIGIVSHDLKNPLMGIQMGALLLSRGELSPHQTRTLARITRSADTANRLISELLDFTQARMGSGLSVTREEIDLHEVLAQTIDDLGMSYPGRKLVHERQGEGTCFADANRLGQLVGNLVSNAMAYGSTGRPVRVISNITEHSCSIAVHNEGSPIAAAALPGLFQPMTRGSNVTGGGRSVGLGLYIVSEIAKAHGGQASVASTEEAGTTFRVELPRVAGDESTVR